ncbi:hypothetical protein OAF78_00385 [Winogradskyella sp.]|jgi:hypothetical protein|uniref:hypothetical protein n=1 Tax=Winogradskyella sp. TaxID=1883156 RepID=UPI00231FEA52|nr:hypothetical protein [Winogradskyella sp.]MDA9885673.1 hypothetical protein [bacterium]MDB4752206.1 hypothetical protein [Winogradskyella sp.]
MIWVFGTIFIFVFAFVIIKLTINTKENPDSKLGILEHPSSFNKQDVEMVDDSLNEVNSEHLN